MNTRLLTVLALIFGWFTSLSHAQSGGLSVVSWNVESGGSDPQTIAQRVRAFQGVDLWGFSEVEDDGVANALETAAEDGENAAFTRIVGTTGGADRLVIVYNADRFDKVKQEELSNINVGGNVRAPLVAQFREKSSGIQFLFMVNHLYRSSKTSRHQQAKLLKIWGEGQQFPVIAVGDYNFDWTVQNGDVDHDEGFDYLTQNGVFSWVRPATLVRSQCNPSYDSVLDFVFVSRPALAWSGRSEIVVVPGDCPDDNKKSDHRPVKATFTLGTAVPPPSLATKEQILQQIKEIEDEIGRLKQLVNQLN